MHWGITSLVMCKEHVWLGLMKVKCKTWKKKKKGSFFIHILAEYFIEITKHHHML